MFLLQSAPPLVGVETPFTPTLAFATPGTSTWSYASQDGTYFSNGMRIWIDLRVVATPTIGTGSGILLISGHPTLVTAVPAPFGHAVVSGTAFTWPTNVTQFLSAISSGTALRLQGQGSGIAATNLQASHMTSGSAHTIQISICARLP